VSDEDGGDSERRWLPGVVETTGSVVALLAAGAIFVNFVGAHLTFFGEAPVIDSEAVRAYWFLVAVLTVGLVASLGGAVWRRARWAWSWHVVVVLVGITSSVAFSVTTAGPVQQELPSQPPTSYGPGAPGCHSGGDSNGCPGG
jgi:hypothetical protein